MRRSRGEGAAGLVPMPGRRVLSVVSRLRRVFGRYAQRHLSLTIPCPSGAPDDVLAPLVVAQGRLLVCGEVAADRVVIRLGAMRYDADLSSVAERPEHVRFECDLPFVAGPLHLTLTRGDDTRQIDLAGVPRWRVQLATLALWPRFGAAVMRSLPDLWRWRRHRDWGAREAVKAALGLSAQVPARPLNPALFDPAPAPGPTAPGVVIILPVYNAFELLEETLERVRTHTDLPWRLILIEDGSSDARVRPFLRDWVARHGAEGRVALIENAGNLGFIASVNKGFARALALELEGWPVVLLNSDAFVPRNWAARLVRPILEDAGVASVTPMSNDAEIFAVPAICAATPLAPGEGDRLDEVAQGLNPQAAQAEAPTGVGFCMAINPDFLAKVPVLDTVFGRGYGEETDWCQKTRALGGRHLGVANVFVEHHGAGSFGSEEKRQRMVDSAAVISARYPAYDQEVQGFVQRDPLLSARLALAIAWAAARQAGPLPIYLAHAMGGGAEKYLERRIAGDIDAGGAAVVLRVGQAVRWQVEVHGAGGVTRGLCDDFALITHLLAPVSQRNIVYNCCVGDREAADIPGLLSGLLRGAGDRFEVLIHDFMPLSPSYTLLDADGTHRGLPAADSLDPAHVFHRADGTPVSLAQWREAWGAALARADEVTVFSESSRALMAEAYPAAAPAIRVRPHLPLADIPRVDPPAPGKRPVIGVLGNVGYQKGAGVLAELSHILASDPRAGLVVVGNLDPGYRLAPPAVVHGSYRHADIPALVARYGITCWLIPSVWPETFSFATREALATGLPVWCFDLGAQAEAVRAAGGQGRVVPLLGGRADPAQLLDEVLRQWSEGEGA